MKKLLLIALGIIILSSCSIDIENFEKEYSEIKLIDTEMTPNEMAQESDYIVKEKAIKESIPYKIKAADSKEVSEEVYTDITFEVLENYKGKTTDQIKVQSLGGEFVDYKNRKLYITDFEGQVPFEEIKDINVILFLVQPKESPYKLDDQYYELLKGKHGIYLTRENIFFKAGGEVYYQSFLKNLEDKGEEKDYKKGRAKRLYQDKK